MGSDTNSINEIPRAKHETEESNCEELKVNYEVEGDPQIQKKNYQDEKKIMEHIAGDCNI